MSRLIKSVDKVSCFIAHLLTVGLVAQCWQMQEREARRTNGGDERLRRACYSVESSILIGYQVFS
jgi:hypothetical protein